MLRNLVRRRPDWALFGALLAAQLVVLACTPVLVGHDLPQHLAYAKLLSDYDAGRLASIYEPPFGDDPYFATHHVLAWLARAMPLTRAITLIYGAYAIAMSSSFAALARAAGEHRRGETCMTIVFGPLLVWSPITCMGFLPFMLGMPAMFAACAAALRFGSDRRARWLVAVAACAAVLASLHVALLAMTLLALACLRLRRPLLSAVGASGAVLAWFWMHRAPSTPFDWDRTSFAVKTFGFVDGTIDTLGLSWSSPLERSKLAVSAVLGPFPWPIKLALGAALSSFALVIALSRKASPPRTRSRRRLLVAGALMALATIAMPSSIQHPDDMCLVDMRMMTLVLVLAVAALPARWLDTTSARAALMALGGVLVGVWGWSMIGAGEEARPGVELAGRLGPSDRVLGLSFHDRSAYFEEDNVILHYVPVHHTALSGGSTTLFWGKFSRHLPIGWAPNQQPPQPRCWFPEEFNDAQLADASHVLVSLPHPDDPFEKKAGAQRLLSLVGTRLSRIACERDWCLLAVVR